MTAASGRGISAVAIDLRNAPPDLPPIDRFEVDVYLYLGPSDILLNRPIPAEVVLDTAYMAELERRARLRGGEMGRKVILREAARDQVFFNDSVP